MEPIEVFVLAGGKSRRFGSDKARAPLAGEPNLARLARQAAASPLVVRVRAIADREGKYADLGIETLADRVAEHGPLAGLEIALTEAAAEWALVLSCDLTELRPEWIERLASRRGEHDAVVFAATRPSPFPGLYRRSALGAVREALATEDRAVVGLLARLRVATVPVPPEWPAVPQVNSLADLERWRAERGAAGAPAASAPARIELRIVDGPLGPLAPDTVAESGATVSFEGVVRSAEGAGTVSALDYEVYDPMASTELRRLAEEVARAHGLTSVLVEHSRGRVATGERSFRLVVTSAHRQPALTATGEFIDRMKRDVPIWKRAVPSSAG
ncbi:MAG: NTP transferase domain-containing protein [Polyangiaceae bacterium]|nr:NTP transferase domain-containing protein [Polyangiaceae bacterium]